MNAFANDYQGKVQVYLTRVRNPETNEALKPYKITSYEGAFEVDTLEFLPMLKCDWAC